MPLFARNAFSCGHVQPAARGARTLYASSTKVASIEAAEPKSTRPRGFRRAPSASISLCSTPRSFFLERAAAAPSKLALQAGLQLALQAVLDPASHAIRQR